MLEMNFRDEQVFFAKACALLCCDPCIRRQPYLTIPETYTTEDRIFIRDIISEPKRANIECYQLRRNNARITCELPSFLRD